MSSRHKYGDLDVAIHETKVQMTGPMPRKKLTQGIPVIFQSASCTCSLYSVQSKSNGEPSPPDDPTLL